MRFPVQCSIGGVLFGIILANNFLVGLSTNDLPKLLLMSFDSFRWDFIEKLPKENLPNFHKFISEGVRVKWIVNVFPTVTRPNHMSMVTGLYAESHGIVHNEFFDPVFNENIPTAGNLYPEDSKWTDVGSEPIWVTNTVAGGGRRSGTILWPCADARIKGILPEKMKRGEWSISENEFSPEQRIDLALKWFTDGLEPINFAAVYFNEPDEVEHQTGPDSMSTLNEIILRDRIVGYLLEKMETEQLAGELNVIITADHGQVPVNPENVINLDLLVDPAWYRSSPNIRASVQPMLNIWPEKGYYSNLIRGLNHIHMHVVTSDNKDYTYLHYATSRRIAPIVIYADEGWVFVTNSSLLIRLKGIHGYDPQSSNMHPFFIAMGPAFKRGVTDALPFNIVDIYSLMCHILILTPASNNGSIDNVRHILAKEIHTPTHLPVFKDVTTDSHLQSTLRSITMGHSDQTDSPEISSHLGSIINVFTHSMERRFWNCLVVFGFVVAILSLMCVAMLITKKGCDTKPAPKAYKYAYSKTSTADNLAQDFEFVSSEDEP